MRAIWDEWTAFRTFNGITQNPFSYWFDIALGRSGRSLEGYLSKLRGRDRVKMVCIDLSTTYRSIVKKYFPNATMVADRLHVIRLINNHFLNTWRSIDPAGAWNRGLLSLMRRHEENRPDQRERLQKYLDEHPVIGSIYSFKQELCRMFLKKTAALRPAGRLSRCL